MVGIFHGTNHKGGVPQLLRSFAAKAAPKWAQNGKMVKSLISAADCPIWY